MKPFLILSFLSMLAFAGCSTSSTVITGEPRDPIDPSEVKVYRKLPPVYEEIGMVQANSKGSMEFTEQGKTDAAMARLKEEAAKLGANGVLMKSLADGYGGSFSIGVGGGSYSGSSGGSVGASTSTNSSYKIASGIAIYVPEPAP
jgi:hypothetical protein